jgi:hypothetical protein
MRTIYFETCNRQIGNNPYFTQLMHDIQPKEQGPYNSIFMGTLIHFLRTEVNIEGWGRTGFN